MMRCRSSSASCAHVVSCAIQRGVGIKAAWCMPNNKKAKTRDAKQQRSASVIGLLPPLVLGFTMQDSENRRSYHGYKPGPPLCHSSECLRPNQTSKVLLHRIKSTDRRLQNSGATAFSAPRAKQHLETDAGTPLRTRFFIHQLSRGYVPARSAFTYRSPSLF